MAKRSLASATDLYLNALKTGSGSIGPANKQLACSEEPTTYTEANTTFALASVTMASGDFTIAAGDTGGNVARKITVAGKSGVSIATSGTATHVALVDTANSLLMYVTTCASQELGAGGTMNFPSWQIELGAPT